MFEKWNKRGIRRGLGVAIQKKCKMERWRLGLGLGPWHSGWDTRHAPFIPINFNFFSPSFLFQTTIIFSTTFFFLSLFYSIY